MAADYLSISDAARAKDTTRTTIYAAIDRGDLNVAEIAGRKLVVCDKKWRRYEPQMIGGRVSKIKGRRQAEYEQ